MSFFDDASLAFLPSGGAGKDGKAYSIKPTDGTGDFTFSRGSNLTATRVGPTGLIEKGRENLLLKSNLFDNGGIPPSSWLTSNAIVTSGQSGYDGSSDAWILEKSATGGFIRQFISTSGVQTFSVYLKANTLDWAALLIGGGPVAYFNISNGTLGSGGGAIDHNIEQVGTSDWYRCSVSFNASVSNVRIYPADGDLDTTGTSGSIYIQDSQLEVGLAATDYIESGASTGKAGLLENEPRFDYSGGATCPSLLLEPQRVQLVPQSEYFEPSATDWRSEGTNGVTITTNDTTSPEGLVNASKLQGGGASNDRLQWNFNTSNTKAMYSVFVKGAGDAVRFSLFNSRSGDRLNYDVDTSGNFTLNSATGITNHDIENYGNGWYRIWGEFTTDAALTNYFQIYSDITGSGAIYLYGAQLEDNASYPTSYIPNHSGGSATRTGETPPFPNAFTFDNLGAGESGTFAFKFKVNGVDGGVFRLFSQGGSGTWFWNSSNLTIYTTSGTLVFGMFNNIVNSIGDTFHICFRKNNNLLTLFVNGQESNTRDMGTDNFNFFSHISTYSSSQSVMQITQYDTALSDGDCITLTT